MIGADPYKHMTWYSYFLQKNILGVDSDEIKKLTEVMLRRDPFYKPPATPDPEHAEAERAR